jgi:crossover junction endodeoxyribonuclease RuvC
MKKNNEKRIILGLDPGTQFVGFAALAVEKNEFIVLGHGVLIPDHPASNASLRILELGQSFKEILKKYKPQDVVIEKSFFHKNADTAFKLGQSRGVYIYESMLFGATVAEYATRVVKKSVTGNGGADKMMVDQALRNLLPISGFNSYDASDAMALAYHHALELKKAALFSQSVRI